MKVLMVNKLYWPVIGGVEIAVRDLSLGLKQFEDSVEVRILTANTSFKTQREVVEGIPITRVASLGRLRSGPLTPTFPFWLRALSSDLYHFHFPSAPLEFLYLISKISGKLVVTYHSDIIRQKILRKLYSPFTRAFLKRADAVIATSPNMVEYSPYLNQIEEKCSIVPFGIETKRFEPTHKVLSQAKEIRAKFGTPLVLFIGRLIYYKGANFLVAAMKNIDAHAVIVGSGPLEKSLKSQAAKLNITDKLHFVGELEEAELPAYYHACDIFVLPSVARSEAFGLVQLEAQACGKPVVSTNLKTGVPYVNQDGVTGIIVPPKDTQALSKAIRKLIEDKDLREKYGQTAKTRVKKEFTRDRMTEEVLDVYKQVLDRKESS